LIIKFDHKFDHKLDLKLDQKRMSVNTNKWLKFFTEAGLPSNVATNYAIIFTDHRIQNDMLCDLTKEILYDMGIKTMGDVIAILRHAKSVHHETTREKMLGTSVNEVGSTSRLSQPSTRLKTNPKTNLNTNPPQVSTQNIITLKRSAQTSVKSTVPKIRRVVNPQEDDYNQDIDEVNEQKFVPNKMLSLESLKNSSAKTSVFSRLGNEKNSETISSIFARLGNNTNSSLETMNTKRRVTISGNGINTSRVTDTNVTQNSLFLRKAVPNKKIILAPKTGGLRSTQNGINYFKFVSFESLVFFNEHKILMKIQI
jgi:hypothetical protein